MEIDDDKKDLEADKQKEENKRLLSLGFEMVFSYIPYEQLNKLWIMGDFTDWEPKEMTKIKDVFTYKTILLKGFKYFYCFNSQDNFYVDFNNEYELNPTNKQSNNYIILPIDNSSNNSNSHSNSIQDDVKVFDFKQKCKLLF